MSAFWSAMAAKMKRESGDHDTRRAIRTGRPPKSVA